MTFIRAYEIESFDCVQRALSELPIDCDDDADLDVYIDDLALTVSGRHAQVGANLSAAKEVLRAEIDGPMSCSIELSKASFVASIDKLARDFARKFGEHAGDAATRGKLRSVPNPGVDHAPGWRRAAHAISGKRRNTHAEPAQEG